MTRYTPRIVSGFNPRPPDGGRQLIMPQTSFNACFNPRPPDGGRQQNKSALRIGCSVSIHAPRMEGDTRRTGILAPAGCFNPRPPDGGRRRDLAYKPQAYQFQSTPPGWRATTAGCGIAARPAVSIHAPRMEGDFIPGAGFGVGDGFNPRPPDGGRPL